jgi:acyl-coenzyme A synthetase/AMP-(fatty) acid ligase
MEDINSLSELISSTNPLPALIIPAKTNPLTISYNQFYAHVSGFQRRLAKAGVNAHDAVTLVLPNSYEFAVAFLAISWQRAIAAPLNPAYKEGEFKFYIEDIRSVLVIVPKGYFTQNHAAVRAARQHQVAVMECFWDGNEVVLEAKYHGKLIAKEIETKEVAAPSDIALVLHTSGTTGKPKAVRLSIIGFLFLIVLWIMTLRRLTGPLDTPKFNSINGFLYWAFPISSR